MSVESSKMIRILFSEVEGEPTLNFVEIENEKGESISVGTWTEDENGYKALEIEAHEV